MTTKLVNVESIGSYFESLSDPRHTRNRKHLLVDIVVIAVCGMVCGCDGPTAIHRWASQPRSTGCKQFLALPNGIPSRDCIRRLLMALKPEAFQKCFQDWIADAVQADDGGPARLIAIDGKTCRRSHDAAKGLGPLHIVSAWASEEGIALGQVATDEKSNEITAIPQLLKQIELTDTLITIDAMGCQKEIARADRRRRRRLRDRRQGQPAEAARRRSRRTSSSTWSATWRTSRYRHHETTRRRARPDRRAVLLPDQGARRTSPRRRTGRG